MRQANTFHKYIWQNYLSRTIFDQITLSSTVYEFTIRLHKSETYRRPNLVFISKLIHCTDAVNCAGAWARRRRPVPNDTGRTTPSPAPWYADKLATDLSWQRFASKVANLQLPHLHLAPPLGVTPFELCRYFRHQKTRVHDLSCGVLCVILRLAVSLEHRLVRDGRTDKQTHDDSQYRH